RPCSRRSHPLCPAPVSVTRVHAFQTFPAPDRGETLRMSQGKLRLLLVRARLPLQNVKRRAQLLFRTANGFFRSRDLFQTHIIRAGNAIRVLIFARLSFSSKPNRERCQWEGKFAVRQTFLWSRRQMALSE